MAFDPRVYVTNVASDLQYIHSHLRVEDSATGTVWLDLRLHGELTHAMDLRTFPIDLQMLTIELTSHHISQKVTLTQHPSQRNTLLLESCWVPDYATLPPSHCTSSGSRAPRRRHEAKRTP
eukprot:5148988-Prymnesium_polylepis.3